MKFDPICVDLEYPRVEGNKNCVEIDLVDVRASDGIRIHYDFDRDGWVISQPQVTHPYIEERSYGYEEEWIEVAFVQSWKFPTYIIEKDGTKIVKE